jgi:hypothetical protein
MYGACRAFARQQLHTPVDCQCCRASAVAVLDAYPHVFRKHLRRPSLWHSSIPWLRSRCPPESLLHSAPHPLPHPQTDSEEPMWSRSAAASLQRATAAAPPPTAGATARPTARARRTPPGAAALRFISGHPRRGRHPSPVAARAGGDDPLGRQPEVSDAPRPLGADDQQAAAEGTAAAAAEASDAQRRPRPVASQSWDMLTDDSAPAPADDATERPPPPPPSSPRAQQPQGGGEGWTEDLLTRMAPKKRVGLAFRHDAKRGCFHTHLMGRTPQG